MNHPLLRASFIAFLILFGIQTLSQAQERPTHTVKTGETLFSIARQYEVSVTQLRDWNNLEDNELSVGQQLIVGQEQGATPNQPQAVTHTVQPQETLFSLSKQYKVSISAIKQWNDLSGNNLSIGQELTLYPPDESASEALPDSLQKTALVVNNTTTENTYYTVKSGDTLYQIAEEHNMTVDELKNLNDLTSNTIRIGQQLTVRKTGQAAPSVAQSAGDMSPQGAFVVHRVESGSSIQSILREFNMTEAEFRALNPDVGSSLRSGQQVTVLLPPTTTQQNPYRVQSNLKNLGQTAVTQYAENQKAGTTTSGELYNPEEYTAAHSNITLGNVIFIRNPRNNKGVYVRVNDRFSGEGLKLSKAAMQTLELQENGSVNIYQDQ